MSNDLEMGIIGKNVKKAGGPNILSLNNCLLSSNNVQGTVRGIGETAVNNIKSLLS